MAGSVNKVILIGNLGKDPEIRPTQSGQKICNLRVATSESWNDRQSGERQERTEWHQVTVMNDKLADVAERYLRKGSQVYIEGKVQTRKWTDQQGQERTTTEIVVGRFGGELTMLGDARNGGDSEERTAPSGNRVVSRDAPRGRGIAQRQMPIGAGLDDDPIPF